ncbi:hypothetical protein, partial [Ferruginibacter sp.]
TQTWLSKNNEDIKIDSLILTNEETDTLPLIQELKFEKKISSSGNYNYFSINLFSGFDKNPFIADERFSDIFFGANQQYIMTSNFEIPANCKFDELPKNIKMIMPDTSIVFSRVSSVTDNLLSTRMTLQFNQPFYSYADYDYFKEFYKKMFELMNEQFVFQKK